MIRRYHYKCLCGAFDYEHHECDEPLNEKGERPCGEAFHVHCKKTGCWNFALDQQYEDDRYADEQERRVDEWRDRQEGDHDDDQD